MSRTVDLAYDFGFDWNVPPSVAYDHGVYPLQLGLTDLTSERVQSLCNGAHSRVDQTACFRVFDFTAGATPGTPVPLALQVLFTAGSSGLQGVTFSPIRDKSSNQLPQLASTDFEVLKAPTSPCYGSVRGGWQAELRGPGETFTSCVLANAGRFQLRALLTVGIPGEPARFYRIDPEMVVGGGPNLPPEG